MHRLSRSTTVLTTLPIVYALAALIGRATRVEESNISLVWPAAAVSIIWMLVVWRGKLWQRWIHLGALGVLNAVLVLSTGAPASLAISSGFSTIALAGVTVWILHLGCDDPVLRDPTDLARLVLAIGAGVVCSAAMSSIHSVLTASAPGWETFFLVTARNGASALVGVALWLRLREVSWHRPHLSPRAVIEALATTVVVAGAFVWEYWLSNDTPLTFMTLLPALWVTLRYSTTVAAVFAAAAAAWIVYCTLTGRGYLAVPDPELQALLAQGLVFSLTVSVLALALYRDSRARLVAEVEAARDRADRDAELLGAVLDSIDEGVVLVDPAGHAVLQNTRATDSGLVRDLISTAAADAPRDLADPGSPGAHDVVVGTDEPRVLELTTTELVRQRQFRVMAFRDVTERKLAELALAESEERFRLAFDTAPMGMFMFTATPDGPRRITRCNQALADFLGRSTQDVLGMSLTDLDVDQDPDTSKELAKILSLTGGPSTSAQIRIRRGDGHTVWGSVSASMVAVPGADPYGICLVEDITSRKLAEAELQHLAMHDPLTGLANRALLTHRTEQAIADIGNHPGQCVGLLYLDLDAFKPVNDTWGHAAGDEVLVTVARRIENSVRAGDTVARLGGDEFAVVCPVIDNLDELLSIAERIRQNISRPLQLTTGQRYDRLSASIGAATSGAGDSADGLIARTDRLMYQAKRTGKSRVAAELATADT